jgi:hypothetical protein
MLTSSFIWSRLDGGSRRIRDFGVNRRHKQWTVCNFVVISTLVLAHVTQVLMGLLASRSFTRRSWFRVHHRGISCHLVQRRLVANGLRNERLASSRTYLWWTRVLFRWHPEVDRWLMMRRSRMGAVVDILQLDRHYRWCKIAR